MGVSAELAVRSLCLVLKNICGLLYKLEPLCFTLLRGLHSLPGFSLCLSTLSGAWYKEEVRRGPDLKRGGRRWQDRAVVSIEAFIVRGPDLSFNGRPQDTLTPIIVTDGFHRAVNWRWEQYYSFSVNDCCRSSPEDAVLHWVTIAHVFGP